MCQRTNTLWNKTELITLSSLRNIKSHRTWAIRATKKQMETVNFQSQFYHCNTVKPECFARIWRYVRILQHFQPLQRLKVLIQKLKSFKGTIFWIPVHREQCNTGHQQVRSVLMIVFVYPRYHFVRILDLATLHFNKIQKRLHRQSELWICGFGNHLLEYDFSNLTNTF